MAFAIDVISDLNALHKVSLEWDNFINVNSDNPFLYTNFLFQVIINSERTPSFFILRFDEKIVGIAPLYLRTKYGVRTAEFYLKPDFNPDFVFDPKYFNKCFNLLSDFLFSTLKCSYLSFTLSKDSLTINNFKSKKDFLVSEHNYPGRLVLNLPNSVDELKKLGGKRVRRDFERTENNLKAVGTWRVQKYNVQTFSTHILEQILNVDRSSWKHAWRVSKNIRSDLDLLIVLNAFSSSPKTSVQNYYWLVWILELEGVPISYQVALISKNVAYFVKTAYDDSYKRFSPGVYICNYSIRDSLENNQIKKVDFITDLQYLKRWKTENCERIQITVSKNLSGRLIQSFMLNQRLKPALTLLANISSFLRH